MSLSKADAPANMNLYATRHTAEGDREGGHSVRSRYTVPRTCCTLRFHNLHCNCPWDSTYSNYVHSFANSSLQVAVREVRLVGTLENVGMSQHACVHCRAQFVPLTLYFHYYHTSKHPTRWRGCGCIQGWGGHWAANCCIASRRRRECYEI